MMWRFFEMLLSHLAHKFGLGYHLIGDDETARQHLAQVWQICAEGEHHILPILAYRLAAQLSRETAEAHLHEGLRLARTHDSRLDIAGCLLKLAQVCDNVAYYNEAYALLSETNTLEWLKYDQARLLPMII